MRVPRSSPYVARSYWEDVADEVDSRTGDARGVAGDDTDFYLLKRRFFLATMLAPATASVEQILEVGCGPGGNLAWLAARQKRVTGVDVSPRMLAHARHLAPDVPLILMDGRRLPFVDRGVEAVMTATVLQHNPASDAVALITEMARVAADEVHLFEDTAWIGVHDRKSHWLRKPRWYVDQMAQLGFELTVAQRLPIAAQEVAAAVARATDRGHREGARAGTGRRRAERAYVQAARFVDRALPAGVGLTRMSFRRRARAESTAGIRGHDLQFRPHPEVVRSKDEDVCANGSESPVDQDVVELDGRSVRRPGPSANGTPTACRKVRHGPDRVQIPDDRRGEIGQVTDSASETTKLAWACERPVRQVHIDNSQRIASRHLQLQDLSPTRRNIACSHAEVDGAVIDNWQGGQYRHTPRTEGLRGGRGDAEAVQAGGAHQVRLDRRNAECVCGCADVIASRMPPGFLQTNYVGVEGTAHVGDVERAPGAVVAAVQVEARNSHCSVGLPHCHFPRWSPRPANGPATA